MYTSLRSIMKCSLPLWNVATKAASFEKVQNYSLFKCTMVTFFWYHQRPVLPEKPASYSYIRGTLEKTPIEIRFPHNAVCCQVSEMHFRPFVLVWRNLIWASRTEGYRFTMETLHYLFIGLANDGRCWQYFPHIATNTVKISQSFILSHSDIFLCHWFTCRSKILTDRKLNGNLTTISLLSVW